VCPKWVLGGEVMANLFEVLGVKPLPGRTFAAEEAVWERDGSS
jgi:hypothetical protein